MVDLLLDRSRSEQTVDRHVLRLTNTPRPFTRLNVRGRIPIGIEDQHTIGTGQIDPQATDAGRQEKDEDRRILKRKTSESVQSENERPTVLN